MDDGLSCSAAFPGSWIEWLHAGGFRDPTPLGNARGSVLSCLKPELQVEVPGWSWHGPGWRGRGCAGGFLQDQQRTGAVESDREIGGGQRRPGAAPGDSGAVALGGGVGILPADELEGFDLLRGEAVSQRCREDPKKLRAVRRASPQNQSARLVFSDMIAQTHGRSAFVAQLSAAWYALQRNAVARPVFLQETREWRGDWPEKRRKRARGIDGKTR